MRRGLPCLGICWILAGCGTSLNLGTDLVWSTDHETGDLTAWSQSPGGGGSYRIAGNPTLAISSERAHSGVYSVKIASTTTNALPAPYNPGGGALFRAGNFPQEAYYSAWYFLPRAVPGVLNWNIIRFGTPATSDGGTPFLPGAGPFPLPDGGGGDAGDAAATIAIGYNIDELFDVRLRYQPNGETTIVLFDHRGAYREERMPSPVPVVPIGRWFQVELFFSNVAAAAGHLSIWLDGSLIYDLARPMTGNPLVYFSACSLVEDAASAELFIDDVAVSRTRVTPTGVLTL